MMRGNYSLLFIVLIYLTYVVGIFYTSNLHAGINELQQKLPILLLPLILSTSPALSKREFNGLLLSFLIALIALTFYSAYLYLLHFVDGGSNVREISPFISHIRFGLMVNLALFLSISYVVKPPEFLWLGARYFFLASSFWLALYLFLLQSLTGIVVFVSTGLIILVVVLFRCNKLLVRYMGILVILITVISLSGYLYIKIDQFFFRKDQHIESLPTHTPNGNVYYHNPDNQQYENGYRVWINVSAQELEDQWNRRSNLPYKGIDHLGQNLNLTLIRYLTSKGLTKDSVGVSALDEKDIQLIESGATSVIFRKHRFGVYPRLYQLLWEIDQYRIFGKVSGSPLIQRMVYQRAAMELIKKHFWFGVGTGDFIDSFNEHYKLFETNLDSCYWYPSHNQFLTQWVALGVVGFVILLVGWFAPFIIEKKYMDFVSLSFMVILTLSMINEDTLETHIGVSMVSLFYGLIVFGRPGKRNLENDGTESII